MKKIITIAILFLSTITFSQIKVIETVPVEKLGRVNDNFYIQKIGNEYTVFFNATQGGNEEIGLKNFTFKDIDNDYKNLYEIISNGFNAKPIYDIKLELPNNYIWLHYMLVKDKMTVQFMVSSKEISSSANVSEPMTKEDLAKLFQKA